MFDWYVNATRFRPSCASRCLGKEVIFDDCRLGEVILTDRIQATLARINIDLQHTSAELHLHIIVDIHKPYKAMRSCRSGVSQHYTE
jgi:hypothetical protein